MTKKKVQLFLAESVSYVANMLRPIVPFLYFFVGLVVSKRLTDGNLCVVCRTREECWDFAINIISGDCKFFEFGVHQGFSLRYFARAIPGDSVFFGFQRGAGAARFQIPLQQCSDCNRCD